MGTLGHQDTVTPGHWDTAEHCDTAFGRFCPYLVAIGRDDSPGTGLSRQLCHAGACICGSPAGQFASLKEMRKGPE